MLIFEGLEEAFDHTVCRGTAVLGADVTQLRAAQYEAGEAIGPVGAIGLLYLPGWNNGIAPGSVDS
jgi:hypothetical protein